MNELLTEKREIERITYVEVIFVLIALLLAVVSLFRSCEVSGISMLDTFKHGDYVLINSVPLKFRYNDVVVFHVKEGRFFSENEDVIKRVIAVEGETVKFEKDESGVVQLYKKSKGADFALIEESYIREPMDAKSLYDLNGAEVLWLDTEFEVPKGKLYVLGDNRNISKDSRTFGAIDKKDVFGKYVLTIEKNSIWDRIYNSAKEKA